MKRNKINKSVEIFEQAVKNLVDEFAKKQELSYSFTVADNPTNAVFFGDYIFDLSEIYHDLKTNQPKGRILDYCDFCMNLHNSNDKEKKTIPDYKSYCMGITETKYYKGFGK